MAPNDFFLLPSFDDGMGEGSGISGVGNGGISRAISPITSIIISVAGNGADGEATFSSKSRNFFGCTGLILIP